MLGTMRSWTVLFATLILSGLAWAQPKFEVYKDVEVGKAGDRMMHVEIIKPLNSKYKPIPVVFIIHAGGWLGDKYAGNFGRGGLVQYGFAVVNIEYRPAGSEARWPAQLEDCLRAIRWVRVHAADYGFDPNKFAAYGESAGAHLAACVALYGDVPKYADPSFPGVSGGVQAVVAGDGPFDVIASQKAGSNSKLVWNVKNLAGGSLEAKPEVWDEICVANHVSKSLPPFFIWHGEKDTVVPIAEAESLVEKLKAAGVPVEFIPVQNGGHDAFTPSDKSQPIQPEATEIYRRQMEFLEKWLGKE